MAFINGANNSNAGGTSVAVTKSVTAGNTLIVLVTVINTAAGLPAIALMTGVADNAAGGTNTYAGTGASYFATATNNSHGSASWLRYIQSIKGTESLTVTASFSSGTGMQFAGIAIAEYSALGNFDVVGAMNGQDSVTTAADQITSGTVSVPTGDTVIGITVDLVGNGTITAGTGFATDYNVAGTYMSESLTQGSTATRGATFKASVTSDHWITGMLAFLGGNTLMAQAWM